MIYFNWRIFWNFISGNKNGIEKASYHLVFVFKGGQSKSLLIKRVDKVNPNEMSNTIKNSYALMYESLCNTLGTSPKNFQLITPPTDWNWKLGNIGETYSQQYSFLDAMPIWSPVGKYQSGSSFHQAYRTWLNTLVIAADPTLENRITKQQNILTGATNDYTQQYKSSMEAYQKEVSNNDPTFTDWLDSFAGAGYKSQLLAAKKNMAKQQELLDEFIDQANDPIIKEANNSYKNQQYYTKVISSTTSDNYMVPGYGSIPDYAKWVQENAGKGEVTIEWDSHEESHEFDKSYAGGSVSVGNWFYRVKVNGKWENVKQLDESSDIKVQISFKPWGRVAINQNPWYNESVIRAKANNKDAYRAGYAPYKEDGQAAWIFGEGGILSCRPTDMLVAYQPTFTITTGSSFSKQEKEMFEAATEVCIGPFSFGGGGGHESSLSEKKVTNSSFSAKSTSEFPVIFGIEMEIFGEEQKVKTKTLKERKVLI